MKSYGQTSFEGYMRRMNPEVPAEEFDGAWEALPSGTKESEEAGAQAVIEEFKRRHNIVIPCATSAGDVATSS